MQRSGAPVVTGVYGNHCTADYMPEHDIVDLIGDRSLPARLTTFPQVSALSRPLSVLAVQGCVKYKEPTGDVLFTQEQYAQAIDPLPGADLVITHCPPAGVNDADDDAHRGITALRRWVDRHQPRWLLHGHTYENPPVSTHGRTAVHWISGLAVVDVQV
ncbi:metallophosphoesterase [Mycobacterium koreense]|uniref:Metallophosphoesterase n=1 Tax=Mycolicibacillus koreensis TaxID=1069220 RepID=A0AA91SSI3_9MYCO|nr:metallophosphoesterase [Mycolicibacillus koreensis]OSC34796.1 metallophosphoesterase [Mycolicibacillus koreensis]